jgi:hypothetical protein
MTNLLVLLSFCSLFIHFIQTTDDVICCISSTLIRIDCRLLLMLLLFDCLVGVLLLVFIVLRSMKKVKMSIQDAYRYFNFASFIVSIEIIRFFHMNGID